MKFSRLACVAVALLAGDARAAAVQPSEEAMKEAGDTFDFAAWDRLLKKFVDGKGRVDYAGLRGDAAAVKELEKLYAQVAATRVDALPSRNAKEAFLIDAYNVVVWKDVVDNQPKQVDESLYKFFRRDYVVGGKEIDLDALEKKWIRPAFKDPRVHVALNCASGGCPLLPNEAFEPERLNAQLDREAKRFCDEKRNVDYDPALKRVKLSRIFDWYAADFDKRPIAWINRYRSDKIPDDAKIEFSDYDWRLNDPSLPR